jgi:hypothetical protein
MTPTKINYNNMVPTLSGIVREGIDRISGGEKSGS